MLRMPIMGCAQLGHSQFALEACGSMCLEILLLYFCAQAALVDAQQLAQHLLYPLVDTPLKARIMSEASFQESFLITDPILIQDVNLIAAVLQKQNLIVNADELQQHLATWDRSDDYVMCDSDTVTLFTKFTKEELALPVEDRVVKNSVDAKVSCAMDLAELETALKDKSVDNMHSLSQRVKQLVLETFNNLLLNIVYGVGVELDQEDILELRDEKITRDLPDIIKEAVKLDTEQRKLRCSGNRNVLGTILGLRNDEWLSGTSHTLCVAFAGSNSDVSPCDHVPITAQTHEDSVCKGNCIKKTSLWQMIHIAQKAQAVTNGFVGEYVGKAQPAGHMEIKKCIDKMYTLRDSLAKDKKSFSQKQMAVSGRMVTDLEMNGVVRGAVEQFNLASNLKRNDVLFPECIRTFATRLLDTQTFFHRLRIALQREVSLQYTVYIPPTNQPRARSKNVKPQHVDIYGYRPLQNTPFELLSVFEFYMYFYVEALLFPDACTAPKRTEWTPLGLFLWKDYLAQKQLHAQPQMPQWAPGKHYTVIEPIKDEYYTFPSEPTRMYEVFRHRWVIVRNRRPYVPVLEGSRLPGPSAAPEDSAKYCSLFFRPWSLVSDTAHVPFLANMGFSRGSRAEALQRQGKVKRRRLIGKKDGTPMNWQQAWDEYIRGNVVSKHAARLVQTFLVMKFAGNDNAPSADDDAVDDSDAEGDIVSSLFS